MECGTAVRMLFVYEHCLIMEKLQRVLEVHDCWGGCSLLQWWLKRRSGVSFVVGFLDSRSLLFDYPPEARQECWWCKQVRVTGKDTYLGVMKQIVISNIFFKMHFVLQLYLKHVVIKEITTLVSFFSFLSNVIAHVD